MVAVLISKLLNPHHSSPTLWSTVLWKSSLIVVSELGTVIHKSMSTVQTMLPETLEKTLKKFGKKSKINLNMNREKDRAKIEKKLNKLVLKMEKNGENFWKFWNIWKMSNRTYLIEVSLFHVVSCAGVISPKVEASFQTQAVAAPCQALLGLSLTFNHDSSPLSQESTAHALNLILILPVRSPTAVPNVPVVVSCNREKSFKQLVTLFELVWKLWLQKRQ